MLWTVHHLWLSGYCFVFNSYRHWSFLILRIRNGTASFLHIREGMTQGYRLDMVYYSIGIILLIKNLMAAHPNTNQPWYADDTGALGTFANIELYV